MCVFGEGGGLGSVFERGQWLGGKGIPGVVGWWGGFVWWIAHGFFKDPRWALCTYKHMEKCQGGFF